MARSGVDRFRIEFSAIPVALYLNRRHTLAYEIYDLSATFAAFKLWTAWEHGLRFKHRATAEAPVFGDVSKTPAGNVDYPVFGGRKHGSLGVIVVGRSQRRPGFPSSNH
jgi:hypothetical protein